MPDSFTPPKGATSVEMRPVLTPRMPYSSASPTRQSGPRRAVKKYAASPYGVSLAMRIASSSVVNRAIPATGPNVSSQLIAIVGVTPVRIDGWKNWPSSRCRP